MYQREIKLSEAWHSRRLTEIMPVNLLNGKNIMQYKRNLSNSKAFTQLRKFKFTETHTRDKEGQEGWPRPNQPPPQCGEAEGACGKRDGWRVTGKEQKAGAHFWKEARLPGLGWAISSAFPELSCSAAPRTHNSRSRYFSVRGGTWSLPQGNSKGIVHEAGVTAGAALRHLMKCHKSPSDGHPHCGNENRGWARHLATVQTQGPPGANAPSLCCLLSCLSFGAATGGGPHLRPLQSGCSLETAGAQGLPCVCFPSLALWTPDLTAGKPELW